MLSRLSGGGGCRVEVSRFDSSDSESLPDGLTWTFPNA